MKQETMAMLLNSGVLLALLGLFYRVGSFATKMEMSFKQIDERFIRIENDMKEMRQDIKEIRKDIAHLDKEVGIITATLRFNGFDLDRHKAEGE